MKKSTLKYWMWKGLLLLLAELCALPLSYLLSLILSSGGLSDFTVLWIGGSVGFLAFLYVDFKIMRNSDLSSIQKKDYVLGELLPYALFTFVLYLTAFLLQKQEGFRLFSWKLLFFPILPFMQMPVSLFIEYVLQVLLFFLFLLAAYAIKKKKDPSMLGRMGKNNENTDKKQEENTP